MKEAMTTTPKTVSPEPGSGQLAVPLGSESTDAALAAAEVSVSFGGVVALKDVSLEFRAGTIETIIGPNGAGKSTLFDILSGMRPPTSGTVYMFGENVTTKSPAWRARHGLRRTFQRQQVFAHLSVLDNLLVAQEWHGGGGGLIGDLLGLPSRRKWQRLREERAVEVMRQCGLERLRDTGAAALTIEASRMLELARCLVGDPKILLLDEPTSGMEQATIDLLAQILLDLRAAATCAIVVVEHNISFVSHVSDHVSVLQLGKLLTHGDWTTIRSSPEVADAYLG
jgi:branched-chain amino acid transport system ATP-binding protein